MSFAGAQEVNGRFAFEVMNKGKLKGFVWVWMERIDPKKPRVPNPGVIAVRVASLTDKDLILASDSKKFFTEPHYAGFPAVLVRLDQVTVADLKPLIADAWRCMAPKDEAASPAPKRKSTSAKRTAAKVSKSARSRRGTA